MELPTAMLEPYQRIFDGTLSFNGTQATAITDPVAIGAVGGSGTRALATVLEAAGLAMASPVNKARDAMEWPPLRRLVTPEAIAAHSRERLMKNILHGFESLLDLRRQNLGLSSRVCWKVPITFLWLEDFADYFPGLQYIHLMRNGLDMAYSGNQNQAMTWAHRFGIELEEQGQGRLPPASVLEYWLHANEHAMDTGNRLLGDRFILLRFEDLCADPAHEIRRLLALLDIPIDNDQLASLAASIQPPDSINRYRRRAWSQDFSDEQLQRLEYFGYFA